MAPRRKAQKLSVVERELHVRKKGKVEVSAFAAAHAQVQDHGDLSTEDEEVQLLDNIDDEESQVSELDVIGTDDELGSSLKTQRTLTKRNVLSNSIYPPVVLSTWQPSEDSIGPRDTNSVKIYLKPGETLLLLGVYVLEVLNGAVAVCGATLRTSTIKYCIHAFSTHAIPALQSTRFEGIEKATIRLSSRKNGLDRLQSVSPLFIRISNDTSMSSELTSHMTHPSFSYVQHTAADPLKRFLQPLVAPPSWFQTFERISRTERSGVPRVLVCGPRNSGKSTFARVLLNNLVSAHSSRQATDDIWQSSLPTPTVCYLDLDPGQPEFSPPGQVSLTHIRMPILGPPYTHVFDDSYAPCRGLRSHSITATSPKEDLQHYLACARDLLHQYVKLLHTFPLSPLIINTPGWIHGEGLETLLALIQIADPSAVIALGLETILDPTGQDAATALRSAANGRLFQTLDSETNGGMSRTSADLRTMQYLSFFHARSRGRQPRWTSKSVNMQPGVSLNYARSRREVLATLHMNDGGPSEELWSTVLHESLVAVVLIEDNGLARRIEGLVHPAKPDGLPIISKKWSRRLLPLDPTKSRLVTVAFVKSIDATERALEIVTPDAVDVWELCKQPREDNEPNFGFPGTKGTSEMADSTQSHTPRLVLLQGFLDTPSWASMSRIHYQRSLERDRQVNHQEVSLIGQAEDELVHQLESEENLLQGQEGSRGERPNDAEEKGAWQELRRCGAGYLQPAQRRVRGSEAPVRGEHV
ncbi:MAG: hypothetical protein Q9162_001847 [Coniocarpon cinnabarinum]